VLGHVGHGEVDEIYDVHVEVDREPISATFEERDGLRGCLSGCPSHDLGREAGHRAPFEYGHLGWVRLVAEEHYPVVGHQREARTGSGELLRDPRLSDHVRHPHRVEDARGVGGGGPEVHAAVEVQERRVLARANEPREHSEFDSAVAAHHERNMAGAHGPLDPVGDRSDDPDHGLEALRVTSRVRTETGPGEIPEIPDGMPRRQQPLYKPRLAQRPRRLLLARPVGTRAGRDAEECERSCHAAPLFYDCSARRIST
jgi:hypothetical protein